MTSFLVCYDIRGVEEVAGKLDSIAQEQHQGEALMGEVEVTRAWSHMSALRIQERFDWLIDYHR